MQNKSASADLHVQAIGLSHRQVTETSAKKMGRKHPQDITSAGASADNMVEPEASGHQAINLGNHAAFTSALSGLEEGVAKCCQFLP